MRFVGIDPGAQGGIAWIDQDGAVEARPLPDTEDAIYDLIHSAIVDQGRVSVALERVHAIPGIGSTSSSFTFGRHYGFVRGVLCGLVVAYRTMGWVDVAPQRWQANLGLPRGLQGPARKRAIKSISAQRFPMTRPTLRTADAILIAEWAVGNVVRQQQEAT